MANPLARSIKSAIKANDMIGDLFAAIGNKQYPRGYVESAYRNARRSMATALQERNKSGAVRDVLSQLRSAIVSDTRSLFTGAQQSGAAESAKQLSYYGVKSPDPAGVTMMLSGENQSAVDAVIARLDAQIATVNAMVVTEQENSAIIGDESRVGVLSASAVAMAAAFWATALVWDSFDEWAQRYSGVMTFSKQAVAALDSRTTECCLRVHAQVQPMSKPFVLTGEPRYADEIDWPGFHWHCRTSGVLYHAAFDDGLTAQMRDGADWFLQQRADGHNPDRDPADAF